MVGLGPSGEAIQLRKVVCRDGWHPGVQLFTKASGEHFRERLDVSCSCFEVLAAGEDLFEPDLLVVGEVVGMSQYP